MPQTTSARGRAELLSHEAIVLMPYKDSVGVWTIYGGHTAAAGSPVPAKMPKGVAQPIEKGLAVFERDLAKYEARVRKAFTAKLSQAQFDAAVSFDYNTGAIDKATWVKRFNAGDELGAREAFMWYRKPAAIVPRREREFALFFESEYSGDGKVSVYTATKAGAVEWSKGKRVDLARVADWAAEPEAAPDAYADKETERNPSSPILPLYRPKQADLVTYAVLDKFAHLTPAPRRYDKVKILFVRGYFRDSMGKAERNDRGMYDDAVFVVTPEGCQPFNGNADPSAWKTGIATVKAEQGLFYRLGLHGYSRPAGPYPALRQAAPMTVSRDGGGEQTGTYWTNLHRGGKTGTSSAGCLTIPEFQWDEFYGLVSGLLKKYGQDGIYVTLLEYAGGHPPVDLAGQTPAEVPVPLPAPNRNEGVYLRLGDRGLRVAEMLRDLHALGFYRGKLDDWFWTGTKTAVVNFQRAHGLEDDAVAGPKTLTAIDDAIAALPEKAAA